MNITDIKRRLENVNFRLTSIENKNPCDEKFVLETLTLAETATIQLRNLYFILEKKDFYYTENAGGINILFEYLEDTGIYKLIVPRLIHKTKSTLNSYIFEPLYFILLDEMKKGSIRKFDEATFCFVHHCSSFDKHPDYDNLETKKLIDLLTSFFVTDDSVKYYSQINMSKKSDNDDINFTEILIYDRSIDYSILHGNLTKKAD